MSELVCRELVELVTHYLDGALPPSELERFEAHLAECDQCGTYVDQFRRTIELTGHADVAGAPEPALRTALLAQFRAWTAEDQPTGS